MNYAILKTGAKQYRVGRGDVIDVEKLPVEEGSSIELNDILAISKDGTVTIGTPLVPGASVIAHVQEQGKDKKILVFKYKRKVRYRRKKGHRQAYTRLAITGISEEIEKEIEVVEEAVEPEPEVTTAEPEGDLVEVQAAVGAPEEATEEVPAPKPRRRASTEATKAKASPKGTAKGATGSAARATTKGATKGTAKSATAKRTTRKRGES